MKDDLNKIFEETKTPSVVTVDVEFENQNVQMQMTPGSATLYIKQLQSTIKGLINKLETAKTALINILQDDEIDCKELAEKTLENIGENNE